MVNVLYSDRTVKSFEYELLRAKGLLGPEDELLVIGPGSPLEELRVLVP